MNFVYTHHYEIGWTDYLYEQYPTKGIDCFISIGCDGGYIGIGIGKVSFGVQILNTNEEF